MGIGLWHAQLNEIETLLNSLELLQLRNRFPNYDQCSASFFRKCTYEEIWRHCIENQNFDFAPTDDSLVQLRPNSLKPPNFSYSYLDCPYFKPLTFEEFFQANRSPGGDTDEYELLRQYDLYASEPIRKESVTPIRYDYSPEIYR